MPCICAPAHACAAFDVGSLVARLLFQPVEEVSRTMFAKLVDAATVDQVDSHVAPGTIVVRSVRAGPSPRLAMDPSHPNTPHYRW